MESKEIWIKIHLDEVLRYWADAYDGGDTQKIVQREYFVDITKKVALFRLVTETKE